jgi:hypothetical protein
MDTFILSLAVTYLQAKDVFSVAQVSKSWNEFLQMESSKNLWQSVWRNTYPSIASCIGDTEEDLEKFMREIRKRQMVFDDDVPLRLHTRPTLKLEDVVCIIELYKQFPGSRKRKHLGFLASSNLDGCALYHSKESSSGIMLKGANLYYENPPDEPTPLFQYAYRDALGLSQPGARRYCGTVQNVNYRVVIFRRDNKKSVCLMDRGILEEGDPVYHSGKPTGQGDYGGIWSQYDTFSESGFYKVDLSGLEVARSSMTSYPLPNTTRNPMSLNEVIYNFEGGSSIARVYAQVVFEVHLRGIEPPDVATAPRWLDLLRSGELEEDDPELSSIPFFEFEIREFQLHLGAQNEEEMSQNGSIMIKDLNEICIVLDALPWE